jgi:metal-dependent hydrolase (beta-lactamase superfamily II)
MKSAFEKAMEKAEKLGGLSPEEMRERKEAEYTALGRAIAERYLGHGHKQLLEEEVGRYGRGEKGIVTGAALSRLVEAIDLKSGEVVVTGRALEGLVILKGKGQVLEAVGRIKVLLQEFRDVRQQKYEIEKESIEKDGRELLHRLRIAGSAVGAINLKSSETWEVLSAEIESQFSQRLEALKRELLGLFKED